MNWRHEVNIKPDLDRYDPDKDNVAEVALLIAGRLANDSWFKNTNWPGYFLDIISAHGTVEKFDRVLNDLYSYADKQGIWLGR